jgi:hypothetical protein
MILYKYKSIDEKSLPYVLDMLINERIYLTCESEVNDPTEGGFKLDKDNYSETGLSVEEIRNVFEKIHNIRRDVRFTCFCKNYDNHLLWAHYAGGYSGIALEYDINEADPNFPLFKISYSGRPTVSIADLNSIIEKQSTVYHKGILVSKRAEWNYENEYRLFSTNESNYINLRAKRVIFGARGYRYDSILKQIIDKFQYNSAHFIYDDCSSEII